MRSFSRSFTLLACLGLSVSTLMLTVATAAEFKDKAEFVAIPDAKERAVALFQEMGKVLQHPRCLNCHPVGDSPLQGMDMKLHEPPVQRGPSDFGVTGMICTTCHMPRNVEPAGVPGNPAWRLAPKEQAWEGKTLGEICQQIKDPERNGGKDLAALHEHMATDELVGWGWHPGGDREPVAGTQEEFGELVALWIEAGAHCPS